MSQSCLLQDVSLKYTVLVCFDFSPLSLSFFFQNGDGLRGNGVSGPLIYFTHREQKDPFWPQAWCGIEGSEKSRKKKIFEFS